MSTSKVALFVSLGLLTIQPPLAASRRAVGKRQEEVVAVNSNAKSWRGRAVDDTDEWGEDEDGFENIKGVVAGSQEEGGAPCGNTERPADSCSGDKPDSRVHSDKLRGPLHGPVLRSVRDRGLVTTRLSTSSILREHGTWHDDATTKNFEGETLGYVTPWHGSGYDFARTFRSKLTYVSPVWYQLRGRYRGPMDGGDGASSFYLAGGHDFDEAWVSDVRNGGDGGGAAGVTKIVPRVVLELQAGVRLSRKDLRQLADLLVTEALERGYDGYVLDVPLSNGIEEFVAEIKSAGEINGKDLLLIQSVRPGVSLSAHLLDRLVPLIHRFSLMTYDYHPTDEASMGWSSRGSGVPNSPLSWVRECVEAFAPAGGGSPLRSMVLLGLPFYGYDNGGAITSDDLVWLIRTEERQHQVLDSEVAAISPISLDWDPLWREHVLSYSDGSQNHVATFPTLAFIQERLDLANELGVGVAMWELGQGMPYFFDLF